MNLVSLLPVTLAAKTSGMRVGRDLTYHFLTGTSCLLLFISQAAPNLLLKCWGRGNQCSTRHSAALHAVSTGAPRAECEPHAAPQRWHQPAVTRASIHLRKRFVDPPEHIPA